ncbi:MULTISPECIES: hypothetical protein [unclassified Paenibacillus]|uniref:hypothetical protein n=1 Tax=unclassified Paenibacillus TaxID=185978 RepID=UPI001AE4CE58|nr:MULTISPECIES: hypothetical protein [unclassified Paenibacillus]
MNTLKRWMVGISVLSMALMLAGCGKQIPEIDPALLNSKASILVMTGPELPDNVKNTLQSTLLEWRDHKQTSFEWMQSTSALTEEQLNQIKARPYDVILVVGHTLVHHVLPAAKQVPERKWVMLDDVIARQSFALDDQHISLKLVTEERFHAEWDEWVRQQLVSGRTIEWVTTSAYPIPSEWAPSEESEMISLADAKGWFTQFQNQVRSNRPSWIAVFAPLEASQLQRLNSMQVPVMNMASTQIELLWPGILTSVREMMDQGQWSAGIQPYSNTEIKIVTNRE